MVYNKIRRHEGRVFLHTFVKILHKIINTIFWQEDIKPN